MRPWSLQTQPQYHHSLALEISKNILISRFLSIRKQFWGRILHLTEKKMGLRFWEICSISEHESTLILKLEAPRPSGHWHILRWIRLKLVKRRNPDTLLWNLKLFIPVNKGPDSTYLFPTSIAPQIYLKVKKIFSFLNIYIQLWVLAEWVNSLECSLWNS